MFIMVLKEIFMLIDQTVFENLVVRQIFWFPTKQLITNMWLWFWPSSGAQD